jgi:hypothetical protein
MPKGSFFKSTNPSHADYGKTIGDIDKRFFAFNCQLKNLNVEILLSLFDIRFTGYKPECIFLVGSNLDGSKIMIHMLQCNSYIRIVPWRMFREQ